MKKLLILFSLLIGFISQAQNPFPDYSKYGLRVKEFLNLADTLMVMDGDTVYGFMADTNSDYNSKYYLVTARFVEQYVAANFSASTKLQADTIIFNTIFKNDYIKTEDWLIQTLDERATINMFDGALRLEYDDGDFENSLVMNENSTGFSVFHTPSFYFSGFNHKLDSFVFTFNSLIPLINYVPLTIKKDSVIVNGSLVVNGDVTQNGLEHVITVAKSGGNFTTIEAALASITDNDSLNRYTIQVAPGFYSVNNPVNLKTRVALTAIGDVGTAVITPQNTGVILNMTTLTSLSGFSIIGGAGNTAIRMDSTGSIVINDLIINSCDTALVQNNTLSTVFVDDVFLASQVNDVDVGFCNKGGSIVANSITVNGQDPIGTIFGVSGAYSTATINNLLTFSANVDTAIYVNDNSNTVINNSSIVSAKNGIVADDNATIKFNGNSHFRITESYTKETNGASISGYANNDDNDDALIIEGQELHVGDAEKGYEVCLGEGDSYSDNILVYEYNGTTYEDVSDSAKNIDIYNVEFPNTSVNTAIYVSTTILNDTGRHHGIKLAMTSAMTIGSGEVVLEYWNGVSWTEFNGMVTDGDAPYAPRAKAYFEQTQGTHIRYDITVTNDDWEANDPMSSGTDHRWVRYRIATAITTSPSINQIKVHSSRFEINADGFTELFGNARNSQLLPLTIGSGEPFEGNMQSQTIYVDENIGVGYQNNRFTATGDKLGFPVNFPDNIDTGCPLNFVWSGRPTSSASLTWTIRWRIVSPDQTLYTTEPAASGLSGSTTVTRTLVAGNNELFSAIIDVSEALPTREGGFGDQLWISIQPTTLTGQFDLTNVGAAYYTWAEGGHF